MCQFDPCEVLEIKGEWAVIKPHGSDQSHRVYIGLLKKIKTGDYLLIHGDMAINKIEKDEAEAALRLTCA